MDVAFFKYAPDWIKVFAKDKGVSNIEAYAWFRKYDTKAEAKYTNLRDRTAEAEAALNGMSTKEQRLFVVQGRYLVDYGWNLSGAQCAQDFVIILA